MMLAPSPTCVNIKSSTQTNKRDTNMSTQTIDLGNNESVSKGVYKNNNGTYTAMTFSKSKDFKTLKGAQKWLAK